MGISMNGPSGIDTASLIDQLVNLETTSRVVPAQKQADAFQVKIDAYGKMRSLLSDITTKARALQDPTGFNLFKATSSDDTIATLKGTTGAIEGNYSVGVFQLAANEKLISKAGLITDQNQALSAYGVTPGTISIDGTEIAVSGTDTIQDLRMKINGATNADGEKLGVTASVMKTSANDYRLILTSKATGSKGIDYKDVSGTALQNLGLITDATGNKGNANQQLLSNAALGAIADGTSVTINGLDHNGNAVAGTFVATGTDPTADFLKNIEAAFHGAVTASIDGSGKLQIDDKTTGSSRLAISSLTLNGSAAGVSASTIGRTGNGVLALGTDAFFSVDNVNMSATSNTADGFVAGISVLLNKAAPDKIVSTTIGRDVEGIQKKVSDFLNAYNAIASYSKDATKIADPKNKSAKDGDLAGDMTTTSIVAQIRDTLQSSLADFGLSYSTLTMIGGTTDSKSGTISLDSDKFKQALATNFDEVVRLFVQGGYSSNTAITYGRSTTDTKEGKYTLEEVDPTHVRIQLDGDPNWYTSDTRDGDVLVFNDGPAKGLSLNVPAGSLNGTTSNFTFTKGIAVRTGDLTSKFTDPYDGLVTLRQDSWRMSQTTAKDRVTKLSSRIEAYRLRLVNQFTKMEQSMNTLKAQSNNMLAQLGG